MSFGGAPVSYRVQGSADMRRMLRSMEQRIGILSLDLSGLHVVTEAATGAYASTAIIAALAGGTVHACSRDTLKHGSAEEAIAATRELAVHAGVSTQISFSVGVPAAELEACDILTNSGRLRPIDRAMVEQLRADAVIALMFEAWEFREADLDRAACAARGIRIAAVNERHRDIAVFPFLGRLCVRQLRDAGLAVSGKRVAVLCDNPFATFLRDGLAEAGGEGHLFERAEDLADGAWDAVVVALLPSGGGLGRSQLEIIARRAPKALLSQFWGDVDRSAARELGVAVHPREAPPPGHMGILLDRLGHEPIIRLQAGSIKSAEIVRRGAPLLPDGVAILLEPPNP